MNCNACDPRSAAAEAYEAAGLIHSECSDFCRDAAAAVAAAVAEAFKPDASVDTVIEAATAYLHIRSAEVMRGRIKDTLNFARESGNFEAFRRNYYKKAKLYNTLCDSRETVPVALAAFYLSGGDSGLAIEYGVNFGRDADTIGTMAGAIAGAYGGVGSLKQQWVDRLSENKAQQEQLADNMVELIAKRCEIKANTIAYINSI